MIRPLRHLGISVPRIATMDDLALGTVRDEQVWNCFTVSLYDKDLTNICTLNSLYETGGMYDSMK